MGNRILLSARGICKAFGPTRALVDVDIDVLKGEVRGLIGENGSGKSTFSTIVAGAQKGDSGTFKFKDEQYEPKNMVDAQAKGISMIVQETGVIPRLTVSANIFTGRLEQFTKFGFLSIKKLHNAANKALEDIGASGIRGEMYIDMLNFEDRKIVEIARAMSTNPDLLIIDETTTALATKGRNIIYSLMNRMRDSGKSVLFISHDLNELMDVCDSITVLRDGVLIETLNKENMSVELMRSLMVGRELVGDYYRGDFDGSSGDEVVLEAKQVSMRPHFKNINLKLYKGEILGLGGLADCGMHELGKVLFGFEKTLTGEVVLKNKKIDNEVTAVKHGIAYVSKDRDRESIIQNATIQSNMVLPSLRKLSKKLGFISPKAETTLTNQEIKSMRIKCRNGKQLIKQLSGGNKQKVVFSKWIAADSDIFILDCPTRGIDVGVKADMYKLLMNLKKRGKSIIMISEELPELLGMSDRILLMKNGEISHEAMRSPELNEQTVIQYII
ncbi:MAG: sugar ABC transporter ATP-binding protein [Defluviitaleaceae bacterium]|nr:sugar ABC transporter ATP-binding protein [Defluviitaleaceae bacterium]